MFLDRGEDQRRVLSARSRKDNDSLAMIDPDARIHRPPLIQARIGPDPVEPAVSIGKSC
jgi:hypothetical protein